jgi:hypothetical protein
MGPVNSLKIQWKHLVNKRHISCSVIVGWLLLKTRPLYIKMTNTKFQLWFWFNVYNWSTTSCLIPLHFYCLSTINWGWNLSTLLTWFIYHEFVPFFSLLSWFVYHSYWLIFHNSFLKIINENLTYQWFCKVMLESQYKIIL